MTPEQIAELDRLAEKATPGECACNTYNGGRCYNCINGAHHLCNCNCERGQYLIALDAFKDALRNAYPQLRAMALRAAELEGALRQSVQLQSHYAVLLNMHDDGQRMTFTAESWIARLSALATHPARSGEKEGT